MFSLNENPAAAEGRNVFLREIRLLVYYFAAGSSSFAKCFVPTFSRTRQPAARGKPKSSTMMCMARLEKSEALEGGPSAKICHHNLDNGLVGLAKYEILMLCAIRFITFAWETDIRFYAAISDIKSLRPIDCCQHREDQQLSLSSFFIFYYIVVIIFGPDK